jgi:hypothetical protein
MCFRNFSQDGTAGEKNKKHYKIKGIKGLKTLLKGVASAGKHDNKLIGSASISLKVRLLTSSNMHSTTPYITILHNGSFFYYNSEHSSFIA